MDEKDITPIMSEEDKAHDFAVCISLAQTSFANASLSHERNIAVVGNGATLTIIRFSRPLLQLDDNFNLRLDVLQRAYDEAPIDPALRQDMSEGIHTCYQLSVSLHAMDI